MTDSQPTIASGAIAKLLATLPALGLDARIDVVARRLAVSGRTLRRRLEAEGTSFREVIDVTRAEMARTYVSDHRMPLSEVAFLLGFSEPSAFHRAFKRWTRTTPGAWRPRGD